MGKKKDIKHDPRVLEMANCMIFAMQSMRNKPAYDGETKKMTTWHAWFKETLEAAGYVCVDGLWVMEAS